MLTAAHEPKAGGGIVWGTAVVWLACFLLLTDWCQAEPLVSGEYGRIAGQEIVLRLTIGAAPPGTLIVTQYLPPGIALEAADPVSSKMDVEAGEVKWLLKNADAGLLEIRMTLSAPVDPSQLRAQVRYQRPQDEEPITLEIVPSR